MGREWVCIVWRGGGDERDVLSMVGVGEGRVAWGRGEAGVGGQWCEVS